ncbi:MAG TPA: PfkB family carbohydrate kinase [Chloroflexota bacterium]|nr:PfkB family carbohydrate kinase [Chloroflexota bacterium]
MIVGHVTRDVVPGGFTVGGAATYAGRMARSLGERVGVVTSASDDFDFQAALPGVEVVRVPAAETSTFENRYVGDTRIQYVRAVAAPLDASAVPAAWRSAEIAYLAPLTNEVAPGVESAFPKSMVAAGPQGWLRRWGADGLVELDGWATLVERLARLDAVILSEDDVQRDEATIDMLRRRVPMLVVTRSSKGGTLFRHGEPVRYPAFPAKEVDPTGAGDAFAAAFLIHLRESRDPIAACLFASCAASFVVEAAGADGIPTPEQISRRLAAGPK